MKHHHLLLSTLAGLSATVLTADARLLLTEIQSNQSSGAGKGDFWELTNTGTAAVDLSGYRWTDFTGGNTFATAIPVPAGTSIAAGESVVFTHASEANFRTWWGGVVGPGVRIFPSPAGEPGLGSADGITFYNPSEVAVISFSYAANAFTRLGGSLSLGGHAGPSGRPDGAPSVASSALVWVAESGVDAPQYTSATGTTHGTFAAANGGDLGSPGYSGSGDTGPSIVLTLEATPATFPESAANPVAVGSVTRDGSTDAALVVTLNSTDITEATVPTTVIIAAGSASATFPIAAVDDIFPDGDKLIKITASAPDAAFVATDVTVQDDGDIFPHHLLLTEIQSQQDGSADDFWELTNVGSNPADISGYSWSDNPGVYANSLDKVPNGTTLAPGESILFTAADPVVFRTFWGLDGSVKIAHTPGAPGLGKNDGVRLFEKGGNQVFFVGYGIGGFTRADGTPSIGGHSGYSASADGSVETVEEVHSMVWVPSSGIVAPRYTSANGVDFGTRGVAGFGDIASPGATIGYPTVSIASASIVEGNSGDSTLALDVTRTDLETAFTVDYAVTGGSATSGSDYTLASGTLDFTASGAATLPINIAVHGDTESEPDETVIVTLSNILNTTGTTLAGTANGTGTILNDEVISPLITTQPADTTIASGSSTTLTVAASGFPAATFQWYAGASGDTGSPVSGATSSSFTTPALTVNADYWVRATNPGGSVDSETATVTVVAGAIAVDLSTYVRVGRFNLPEPTRTPLPAGTASHNLLCQEASGVAYNWDTDTLFICGDGGRSVTQVTKTGELVDTMSLALNPANPQGTEFYDPEGITYIGGGEFVLTEERERRIVKFTYAAGTTLTRANSLTVDLGTFDDNTGTEGLSYDPLTGGFICLKEKNPLGVFLTAVDWIAGTATNGSPTTVNSVNLFDTASLGMTDTADIFALSNLPAMAGMPQEGNLIIIGQENSRVVNISRTGVIHSTLNIVSDPGNPLSAADQQHEGVTMDRAGNLYVVNENGGGSIDYPQLWVYASSASQNQPPASLVLNNVVGSLQENTGTASPVKVADIVVNDDGLGTNTLGLAGADSASFEIVASALYLKAGVNLDYETKTSYSVTVSVDDLAVGTTPDATVDFTLTVLDQVVETPAAPALVITEVAPWSSGNSPVGADWFEVTNVSDNAVNVTGWKVDDGSAEFSAAVALGGITSIAPGESVIFIETANLAATRPLFLSNWFGADAPSGLQIGSYSGGSTGLSTGGDEVNLYNSGGVLQAKVTFGAADGVSPYQTFDNTVALNAAGISQLSLAGTHGAFVAVNSPAEIGSPGYSAPGVLRITEIAPWSSGNSPIAVDWFEVTNSGARPVNITGWKVDDGSESPVDAVALHGITSIAPGESVIFMETADLPGKSAAFKSLWFGGNPPSGLQIGNYTGGGIGLSTGGDAVNLYDTANPTPVRRANVSFGIAPSSAPFGTFDNTEGVNVGAVTLKSVPGLNHAFVAANDAAEAGSPGISSIGGSQSFGRWLASRGYSSGGLDADTDGDGLTDRTEFFFNLNPNKGGGFENLPYMVNSPGVLEMDFTTLADTGDVQGAFQVSDNLETWRAARLGLDYIVISSTTSGDEKSHTYGLALPVSPAPGVSPVYLTPNTSDPVETVLGGARIVNHGLVGVGRLGGDSVDKFGETQGASSGLAISGWAYEAGQFSGTFQVLPDRGYGDGTSNYAARLHEVDFTFSPYYGAGPVPQDQVAMEYSDSTKFTYQDGETVKFTTGLNPSGNGQLFGQTVGTVTAANGPGGVQESLLSFDAEAIHLFQDGSGFVSDEYGTYIARFDSGKRITGITQLPEAARPRRPSTTLNFDSLAPPTSGRRNNQGLEGMSVTPDESLLFALLQSATVQDTSGSQQQTRINARLFVYNIAGENRESPVLIGEYVVKLPRIDLNSDGSGADGTAAQSEIVALGPHSFLMLPRDGNGLGKGTTIPIVFKSVQLVDFSTATNIIGTYDGAGVPVSPSGVLTPGVNAAATAEIINMLKPADLAKFGLNSNTNQADSNTLNEKIEGMALVPDLSTPETNDFFLFVANDNDFQSPDVQMLDAAGNLVSRGDGRLNTGVTNDAMFYVWRLSIDTGGKKFFRFAVE